MAKAKRKRKPDGLQFDLDQEMTDQARIYSNSPEVTIIRECFQVVGEGDPNNNFNKGIEGGSIPPHPPQPPLPPPSLPCFYGDPATRETIRRKLKELGVTNISQLIRTYQAAVLIEAISDFERALDAGMRVKSPTAYFRSLLK